MIQYAESLQEILNRKIAIPHGKKVEELANVFRPPVMLWF